ncbi:hypothetical protein COCMIDRAFT_97519, partial [Bipolaris oryzae ATCC 44560]
GRGCDGALGGGKCCRAIALPLGAVKECSRGAWLQPPRIELGNGTTTVPQGEQTAWRRPGDGCRRA